LLLVWTRVRLPPAPPSPARALAKAGFALAPVHYGGLQRTKSTILFLKMHYVYILKCADDSFYTGCTADLKERMNYHNKGLVHSTKNKRPVKLITYLAFSDKYKAFDFEKYLKSGSGRAFAQKRLR